MVETLAQTYTSEAEIKRLLSTLGAELRIDDVGLGVGEEDVWADVINEATDFLNFYLEPWYEPGDIQNNQWCRRAATVLGVYFLSQRRGNPAILQDRVDRITTFLERVFKGEMQVPRLPTRSDMTPAMSNLRVSDRYIRSKLRVQQSISTGGTSAKQDPDPLYPHGEWPG